VESLDIRVATLTLMRTFLALCVAPFGTVAAYYVIEILRRDMDRDVATIAAIAGLTAFVSSLVFVFPVLAFVPRLRKPSFGLAAIWGALVACGWAVPGVVHFARIAWLPILPLAALGAASGLVYAAVARRL